METTNKVWAGLNEHTWKKGANMEFNGKACIAAHIARVYGRNPPQMAQANDKLSTYVQNKGFAPTLGGLFAWNDAPERTLEEVISTCKELDI